jgi:signal transduction histidine kinase
MLSGIKYAFSNLKNNLVMTTDNAMSFERAIDMLDTSIREMRRVAYNMMPEALLKFGLDAALRDFCSEINFAGSIKITYQSFGLKESIIEQSKSIAIYRIIQELINNALKHSGASEMLVQLSFDNEKMSITVEDNGKGFDVQQLEKANGIGWRNIRNRVDFIKGTLDIHSSENNGTSVLIEFDV